MKELFFVRQAIQKAVNESKNKVSRERSKAFVTELANLFRQGMENDKSLRVLSRDYDGNRSEFGLNELLYDILVCKVGQVHPPHHAKELTYIVRAIWQVESEFSKDSRHSMKDFNKLVLGNAPYKLFIGSLTNKDDAMLRTLRVVAAHCTGEVFIALLPHPEGWKNAEQVSKDIRFLQATEQDWKEMAL